MNYFDDPKNVDDYIKMVEGNDSGYLLGKLEKYLSPGSTLLEIGTGPGKDLDLLRLRYEATGSDLSQVFIDKYLTVNPQATVLKLDAVTLNTNQKFHCVYSNKVLHHLPKDQLPISFYNQDKILESGGIVMHTFWYGDKIESFDGLLFVYYTINQLKEILPENWDILEASLYKEMNDDDSICLIARKTA